MKVNFNLRAFGLALSLNFLSFSAQSQDGPNHYPKRRFFDKIGFSAGLGTGEMKVDALNQRLAELQIGRVDPILASRTISLYGVSGNLGVSMDVNLGTAFENELFNPDSYLSFETFSLGVTFYAPLLQYKRFNVQVLLGFRFTNMSFEYNGNTNAATNFSSLLSNPAGNSSFVRLRNNNNECFSGGARFQYRLGKKENGKPREYKLGFDSGYIYGFRTGFWVEPGSRHPVPDMPKTRPDHFYFLLTFSGYFNL
jgi:hypothetical protein